MSSTNGKTKHQQLPVGDDSYEDLRAHIIGMGRKEFQKVMRNPELAYDRAVDGKYTESFSYAIPSRSDYQKKIKRPTEGGKWPEDSTLWFADFPDSMVKKYQQLLQKVESKANAAVAINAKLQAAEGEVFDAVLELDKVDIAFKTYMSKNTPSTSGVELAHRPFRYTIGLRRRDNQSLESWANDIAAQAKRRLSDTKSPRTHKDG